MSKIPMTNPGAFGSKAFGVLGGIKVIPNPNMIKLVQSRFPRSKSKRIRKKWKKDLHNWHSKPSDEVYADMSRGVIYCHPVMFRRIKEEFDALGI